MTTSRLESPLDQDLHRSAHNLRALVIAKGLANVVALIATAVMAHSITPEDRGIVALAVFYVTFGVQVFDIGVDPALQRLGSDRHWVSAHFFVRLITAVMLTLLGIGFYLFSNTSESVKIAT